MQLTTIEELQNVKVNDTLFLINPFGNGDQSKVSIEAFTVSEVLQGKFNGRSQFLTLDIDYNISQCFGDLISRCKYVYTTLNEANNKLAEVRKGLHTEEVADHHEACERMFNHFNNYHNL